MEIIKHRVNAKDAGKLKFKSKFLAFDINCTTYSLTTLFSFCLLTAFDFYCCYVLFKNFISHIVVVLIFFRKVNYSVWRNPFEGQNALNTIFFYFAIQLPMYLFSHSEKYPIKHHISKLRVQGKQLWNDFRKFFLNQELANLTATRRTRLEYTNWG